MKCRVDVELEAGSPDRPDPRVRQPMQSLGNTYVPPPPTASNPYVHQLRTYINYTQHLRTTRATTSTPPTPTCMPPLHRYFRTYCLMGGASHQDVHHRQPVVAESRRPCRDSEVHWEPSAAPCHLLHALHHAIDN